MIELAPLIGTDRPTKRVSLAMVLKEKGALVARPGIPDDPNDPRPNSMTDPAAYYRWYNRHRAKVEEGS